VTTRRAFIGTLAGGFRAAPAKGLAPPPSSGPPRRQEGVHVAEPHPNRGR
jgi:hypothetical protein